MHHVVEAGLDVEDILYQSPSGPIAVQDVIYGYGKEIETTGNDFYAHKTGFTPKSLHSALERAGFSPIFVSASLAAFEIRAFAFKSEPTSLHRELLDLPASAS
jgi:hypothetical protein